MSKFDDKIQQLINDGALDEADAAALRDASPLKAERDAAEARAADRDARATALEAKEATRIFAELSIPGAPGAYNLPAEVDITDKAQVQAWAQAQSLVAPAGPTPEEQAAHERMAAATSGGNAPVPVTPADRMADVHKQVRTAGVNDLYVGSPLYNKALDTFRESGLTFGDVPHGAIEPIPEWGATK